MSKCREIPDNDNIMQIHADQLWNKVCPVRKLARKVEAWTRLVTEHTAKIHRLHQEELVTYSFNLNVYIKRVPSTRSWKPRDEHHTIYHIPDKMTST